MVAQSCVHVQGRDALPIKGGTGVRSRQILSVVLAVVVGTAVVTPTLIAFRRLVELRAEVAALKRRIETDTDAGEQNLPDSSSTGEQPGPSDGGPVDSDALMTITTTIDSSLEVRNRDRVIEVLGALLTTIEAGDGIPDLDLTVRRTDDLSAVLASHEAARFTVTADPVNGKVEVVDQLGDRMVISSQDEITGAVEFLVSHQEEFERVNERRATMTRRIQDALTEMQDLLDRRELGPSAPVEEGPTARLSLRDPKGTAIVRLEADARDGRYYVNGEAQPEDELGRAIRASIEEYDPQDARQRVIDSLSDHLESTLQVGGIQEYLRTRNVTIAEWTRSDGVLTRPVRIEEGNGADLSRFVIDPEEGTLALHDPLEGGSTVLKRVIPPAGAAESTPSEGVTFLLVGTHDNLADAIVLLRATPSTLAALSVPRDLYVGTNKLSELHYARGTQYLIEVVESVTDTAIDHYVRMDLSGLEAFLEVFDTIEVNMEEEILDPSTTYTADGSRRILFFPRGTHEVDADAAMALIRSRATTSDYSRSRRQRAILDGVRRRLQELSLKDTGRALSLLETAFTHAQTDMSLGELVAYYRRFGDVGALRHHGLTADNVLYSTYSKLHERGLDLADHDELEGENPGAWILRPLHDDWELLRWYTASWFSGGHPEVEDYPGWSTLEEEESVESDEEDESPESEGATSLDLPALRELGLLDDPPVR